MAALWSTMRDWLVIPTWLDLIDISLVAVFAWLVIRYVRRTRARAALAGVGLLGVVYLIAVGLDLRLTASLFRGFFAVLVILLVVVFQEDLRRLFEQLGSWRRGRERVPPESETLDLLVRTTAHLAANRTGALIVLPGREPLDRHIEGGIALGGRVSEPLLLSLFDASSPGHDGAVLLRGSQVERFAVHLPLSANHEAVGPGGTRHAAALGLAERCDATCIVVSEERGTVSLARSGELRVLGHPEDLAVELRSIFQPSGVSRPWWRDLVGVDAALALAGALLLWTLLVPGSDEGEVTYEAPVDVTNLPKEMQLESIEPDAVQVTLAGLRRDLLLAEGNVSIRVDAYLSRLGRRTFTLSPQDVQKPDRVSIVSIEPSQVKLSLKTVEPAAPVPPAGP